MSSLSTFARLCRPPHICQWKWNIIDKATWDYLKQTTAVDESLAKISLDVWANSDEEFFTPPCSLPSPIPPLRSHTVSQRVLRNNAPSSTLGSASQMSNAMHVGRMLEMHA